MISMVSAVPPFVEASTGTSDLDIEIIAPVTVQVGTSVNITIHTFNRSNGVLMLPGEISCRGLLVNQNGFLITKQVALPLDHYFNFLLNETMALTPGFYEYTLHCNNSYQGGYHTGFFQITNSGSNFTIQMAIFYFGIMAILAFLFVVTIFGFNLLPNQDPKDLDGKLMDINWLKYLRYPIGILAWGELTMIFWLGWNIAEGYLFTGLAAQIFELLYRLNFYSLMIALPVMFFYIVVKAIEDKKFKAMIERGIM